MAKPTPDVALPGTIEIDDRPESPRLRRPSDLLRLSATVLAIALLILPGVFGLTTVSGLQGDITTALTGIPNLLVRLLTAVSRAIVLSLPVLLIGELMWRRRWRALISSVGAASIAYALAILINNNAEDWFSPKLYRYMTQTVSQPGTGSVVVGLFAAVVAFATVDGMARHGRTGPILWVSLMGLGVLQILDYGATIQAVLVSVLGGYALGLIVRYVLGSDNPRVPTSHILAACVRSGIVPVTARQIDDSSAGRRFVVDTASGESLSVQVFDPDRRAPLAVAGLWRSIIVSGWVARAPSLSNKSAVQRAASPMLMANLHGMAVPRLSTVLEVNNQTMVLAHERPEGLRFATALKAEEITDETVRSWWAQLMILHRSGTAHERLSPTTLAIGPDGAGWLSGLEFGELAGSALRLRLDRAEMLIATSILVGTDRAVEIAADVLGLAELGRLPTLMQKIALNVDLKAQLRNHRGLLDKVQQETIGRTPVASSTPERPERISLKTIVMVILVTGGVYALAGQLASINVNQLVRDVDAKWAGAAVAASFMTYVGAALTVSPFSSIPIRWFRWLEAQFAASFVVLAAPAAVGSAGTNARLMQKAGMPPALALATVGVSTAVSVVTSIVTLAVAGVLSSTDPNLSIPSPSQTTIIAAAAVGLVIAVVIAIPAARKAIVSRLKPFWDNTIPRLLAVVRDPRRVLRGAAGNLLTTLSYSAAMYAAVNAYGGSIPIAAAIVVVLGAGLVGTVAPTPGGLGAVEAALVAGLTAIGIKNSVALPAALLYRAATFLLPTIPGWLSLRLLQRADAI